MAEAHILNSLRKLLNSSSNLRDLTNILFLKVLNKNSAHLIHCFFLNFENYFIFPFFPQFFGKMVNIEFSEIYIPLNEEKFFILFPLLSSFEINNES